MTKSRKQLASCGTCIFSKDPWKRMPIGDETLWCRRYPPTNESGAKRFPIVKLTDWCGEHSEQEIVSHSIEKSR